MRQVSQWLSKFNIRKDAFLQPRGTIELGDAWAGNTVNCVPYRIDAVRTSRGFRYLAFFDSAGDVAIAQVNLSTGKVAHATISNERKPYDAHQAISIGLDRQGLLHLAFGAHNSTLMVTCSRSAQIEDGFEEVAEACDGATYPMFLNLAGEDLVRLHRRGRHFEGEICVERFMANLHKWEADPAPLISGFGSPWSCGPYLNTPVVGQDGTIHLFLVWRLSEKATSAGSVVNVGVDAAVSYDGLRTLYTHQGIQTSAPLTPITSERVVAVPLGASLINQGAATLLPSGDPAALTYWDSGDGVPQYRLCWLERSTWRTSTISSFKTSFRLDGGGTLPLPHSRPELLSYGDGRLLVLYRSTERDNALVALQLVPPYYDVDPGKEQILVKEDLGYYEPVVDRAAWQQGGELAVYVQSCAQGFARDGRKDVATAPARLMMWNPVSV